MYDQGWYNDDDLWWAYQSGDGSSVAHNPGVESNPERPAIEGGRGVAGTIGGIAIANIVGAGWTKLKSQGWDPNGLKGGAKDRAVYAAMLVTCSTASTFAAAPNGSRTRAALGCVLGNLVAQAPLMLAPELAEDHSEAVHAWQSLLPIAGTLIASNM